MFHLTHKQLLELKYWAHFDKDAEYKLRDRYMELFGLDTLDLKRHDVLEIGTGPLWGLLSRIDAARMYAVDPLYEAYRAIGVLENKPACIAVCEPFEHWETNLQFDVIVTTNALDHGDMGFYLMVKMWRMMKRGGRLYIHVHLRPPDMLNLLHDHCLTEAQLDRHLANTDLVEMRREIHDRDVDGNFCRALIGVWTKP
jgi:2-polyprenyl-3-methyl-5-hydroxy-6-metoxy-1,4-benzoquinol methylase